MDETVKQLLNDVRVAAPCAARWDDMPGSDQVRSCSQCRHKVYNLSEMTAPQAADLLHKAEGRICVRFYRRADGTLMTKDCPSGLRAARAVRVRIARAVSVSFASLLVFAGFNLRDKPRSEYPVLLRLLLDSVAPEHTVIMGAMPRLHASVDSPPVPATAVVVGKPLPEPTLPVAPSNDGLATVGMVVTPVVPNKPFLRDLPVEPNAPRADPFARPERIGR